MKTRNFSKTHSPCSGGKVRQAHPNAINIIVTIDKTRRETWRVVRQGKEPAERKWQDDKLEKLPPWLGGSSHEDRVSEIKIILDFNIIHNVFKNVITDLCQHQLRTAQGMHQLPATCHLEQIWDLKGGHKYSPAMDHLKGEDSSVKYTDDNFSNTTNYLE